jgi:hypothetical protein
MRVADVKHAVFTTQAIGTALHAASIPNNVNLNWAPVQGENANWPL